MVATMLMEVTSSEADDGNDSGCGDDRGGDDSVSVVTKNGRGNGGGGGNGVVIVLWQHQWWRQQQRWRGVMVLAMVLTMTAPTIMVDRYMQWLW